MDLTWYQRLQSIYDAILAGANRCPLPEGAGQLTVLSTGGAEVACTVGGVCQAGAVPMPEMYDCIQGTSGGICCPSKGFAIRKVVALSMLGLHVV